MISVRTKSQDQGGALTIKVYTIPPPIHCKLSTFRELSNKGQAVSTKPTTETLKKTHLQRKEDKNQTNHRATIQRRTRHIIKLAPPPKVPSSD